jgi:hypothetical protein
MMEKQTFSFQPLQNLRYVYPASILNRAFLQRINAQIESLEAQINHTIQDINRVFLQFDPAFIRSSLERNRQLLLRRLHGRDGAHLSPVVRDSLISRLSTIEILNIPELQALTSEAEEILIPSSTIRAISNAIGGLFRRFRPGRIAPEIDQNEMMRIRPVLSILNQNQNMAHKTQLLQLALRANMTEAQFLSIICPDGHAEWRTRFILENFDRFCAVIEREGVGFTPMINLDMQSLERVLADPRSSEGEEIMSELLRQTNTMTRGI